MARYSVILTGGAPWGFRIKGGNDAHEPICIAKINPRSKAAATGSIEVGDLIRGINHRPTSHLDLRAVQEIIYRTKDNLELTLERQSSRLPNGGTTMSSAEVIDTKESATINMYSSSTSPKIPAWQNGKPAEPAVIALSSHVDFMNNNNRANAMPVVDWLPPPPPDWQTDYTPTTAWEETLTNGRESPGVWQPGQAPVDDEDDYNVREESLDLQPVWAPSSAPSAKKEFRSVRPPQQSPTPTPPPQVPVQQKQAPPSPIRRQPSPPVQRRAQPEVHTAVHHGPPSPRRQPSTRVTPSSPSQTGPPQTPPRATSRKAPPRKPNVTVITDPAQLPPGALYQKLTIDGDKIHTDTYYPTEEKPKHETTNLNEETKAKLVQKAPTYEGIGPRDHESGMPLGLRQHVKEENRQDWYKEMYKSIHKQERDEDHAKPPFETQPKKPAPNDVVSTPVNRYRQQPRSIVDYEPGKSSLVGTDKAPIEPQRARQDFSAPPPPQSRRSGYGSDDEGRRAKQFSPVSPSNPNPAFDLSPIRKGLTESEEPHTNQSSPKRGLPPSNPHVHIRYPETDISGQKFCVKFQTRGEHTYVTCSPYEHTPTLIPKSESFTECKPWDESKVKRSVSEEGEERLERLLQKSERILSKSGQELKEASLARTESSHSRDEILIKPTQEQALELGNTLSASGNNSSSSCVRNENLAERSGGVSEITSRDTDNLDASDDADPWVPPSDGSAEHGGPFDYHSYSLLVKRSTTHSDDFAKVKELFSDASKGEVSHGISGKGKYCSISLADADRTFEAALNFYTTLDSGFLDGEMSEESPSNKSLRSYLLKDFQRIHHPEGSARREDLDVSAEGVLRPHRSAWRRTGSDPPPGSHEDLGIFSSGRDDEDFPDSGTISADGRPDDSHGSSGTSHGMLMKVYPTFHLLPVENRIHFNGNDQGETDSFESGNATDPERSSRKCQKGIPSPRSKTRFPECISPMDETPELDTPASSSWITPSFMPCSDKSNERAPMEASLSDEDGESFSEDELEDCAKDDGPLSSCRPSSDIQSDLVDDQLKEENYTMLMGLPHRHFVRTILKRGKDYERFRAKSLDDIPTSCHTEIENGEIGRDAVGMGGEGSASNVEYSGHMENVSEVLPHRPVTEVDTDEYSLWKKFRSEKGAISDQASPVGSEPGIHSSIDRPESEGDDGSCVSDETRSNAEDGKTEIGSVLLDEQADDGVDESDNMSESLSYREQDLGGYLVSGEIEDRGGTPDRLTPPSEIVIAESHNSVQDVPANRGLNGQSLAKLQHFDERKYEQQLFPLIVKVESVGESSLSDLDVDYVRLGVPPKLLRYSATFDKFYISEEETQPFDTGFEGGDSNLSAFVSNLLGGKPQHPPNSLSRKLSFSENDLRWRRDCLIEKDYSVTSERGMFKDFDNSDQQTAERLNSETGSVRDNGGTDDGEANIVHGTDNMNREHRQWEEMLDQESRLLELSPRGYDANNAWNCLDCDIIQAEHVSRQSCEADEYANQGGHRGHWMNHSYPNSPPEFFYKVHSTPHSQNQRYAKMEGHHNVKGHPASSSHNRWDSNDKELDKKLHTTLGPPSPIPREHSPSMPGNVTRISRPSKCYYCPPTRDIPTNLSPNNASGVSPPPPPYRARGFQHARTHYQYRSLSLPRRLPRWSLLPPSSMPRVRKLSAAERLGVRSPPPRRTPSLTSLEGMNPRNTGRDKNYNYKNTTPNALDKAALQKIMDAEKQKRALADRQIEDSRRHSDYTPTKGPIITDDRFRELLKDAKPISDNTGKNETRACALAIYDFAAQSPKELSFRKGDTLYLTKEVDGNWYKGEHHGRIGIFPRAYVEVVTSIDEAKKYQLSLPGKEGKAKAKFKFKGETNKELSFNKHDYIDLIQRIDGNWWEGRIGARTGILPDSYIDVLKQPEVRSSPLSPTGANRAPLSPASGGGHSPGAASPRSPSSRSPGRQTAPQQTPVSPRLTQTQAAPVQAQPSYHQQRGPQLHHSTITPQRQQQQQRAPPPQQQAAPVQTYTVDRKSPTPIMRQPQDQYQAMFNYMPQNEDELELRDGDMVVVLEKCDDGWFVGTSMRTGMFGTFPGNYVTKV